MCGGCIYVCMCGGDDDVQNNTLQFQIGHVIFLGVDESVDTESILGNVSVNEMNYFKECSEMGDTVFAQT